MPFNRKKSNAGLLRPISMNLGSKGVPADLGTSLLLATMRTGSSTITTSIEASDLTADDVIVLLMGPPGSGKTTFLETSGGIGRVANSTDILAYRVSASKFASSNVVLVDTPAFNDTDQSDLEILKMLSDWLNETYQRGVQLSGLIYFHRISDEKMEGTPLRNWRAFEKICGEGFNKVVLTTTMWDDVDDEVGHSRERELEDFWRAHIARGLVVKRFLGDRPSAADVLSPILEDITKRPLRLQREITDLRMTLKQTTAARVLFLQLGILLWECEQSLVTIRDDLKNPSLSRQELSDLEEKFKHFSDLLERVTAGLTDLKVAPAQRVQRFFLMSGVRPALGYMGLGKRPESEGTMDGRGDVGRSSVTSTSFRGQKERAGDRKLKKQPR